MLSNEVKAISGVDILSTPFWEFPDNHQFSLRTLPYGSTTLSTPFWEFPKGNR